MKFRRSRPRCGQAYRREEKTAGGIIIPDSAKEKPSQGEIHGGRLRAAATNPGKLIPIDLKVGDRVLFGKCRPEVKLDGEELLIMKESDIMGVLTDMPIAKKAA